LLSTLIVPAFVLAQACSPCKVVLGNAIQLGDVTDPVARNLGSYVVALKSGGFVVAPWGVAPHLGHYSRTGRFLGIFDRQGRGPGELEESVRAMTVDPAGEVNVLNGARRILHWKPGSAKATSRNLPMTIDEFLPLANGLTVVNAGTRDGASVAVIHVIDRKGRILRSSDRLPSAARQNIWRRALAPAADGGFWTLPVNDSRLSRYSEDGRLLKTVQLHRPWFKSWQTTPGPSTQFRPVPRNTGIQELPDGRLVITTLVADSKWEPKPAALSPGLNATRIVDTIVDVFEPVSGRIVASARFDESLRLASGVPGFIYAARTDNTGDVKILIWQLGLKPEP